MTDLPTYAEARSECIENDNPSALAWFITEHEGGRPGSLEEQTFRADLHAAIEEAKCQGFQEAEEMFDAWKNAQNGVCYVWHWYGFWGGFFWACVAISVFCAIYISFFHAGVGP